MIADETEQFARPRVSGWTQGSGGFLPSNTPGTSDATAPFHGAEAVVTGATAGGTAWFPQFFGNTAGGTSWGGPVRARSSSAPPADTCASTGTQAPLAARSQV